VGPAESFVPSWDAIWHIQLPVTLDLRAEGIETVVWATGFKRTYPWLRVPVLDERGEIRHRDGVTPSRGLYVLGMQFQRQRKSAFLDGVGEDADYLAARISRCLATSRCDESVPQPLAGEKERDGGFRTDSTLAL
jgi:hypothetical protein